MSDRIDSSVGPVSPINGARPVQPVREDEAPATAKPVALGVGATTGGSLPPAYAEFVVSSETQDIVLQVRDPRTNEIVTEYPSRQVEAMAAYMKQYAATLARRQAAQASAGKPKA
jgi:FlaG protein